MGCNNEHQCNDVLPNFWDTFGATKALGTPNDILWTTPYLQYALMMGPNIIVFDPDPNKRSLLLGDWRKANAHNSVLLCREIMGGEVLNPGYIYGSLIRGFELRYEPYIDDPYVTAPKFYKSKKGKPSIRLAFYKRRSLFSGENKSYVIIVAPPVGVYCITNNENMPHTSDVESPPLTACDFENTKGFCLLYTSDAADE